MGEGEGAAEEGGVRGAYRCKLLSNASRFTAKGASQIEAQGPSVQRGHDRSPIAIGGYEMSGFAEAVQAILVIAVIGLAIRNGKLKREKELLLKQQQRIRDKEQGENPELAAAQETAKNPPRYSPVVSSGNSRWVYTIQNTSCPDCGSIEFEMRTYGGPWEYADTHCANCGKLIRRFDAA